MQYDIRTLLQWMRKKENVKNIANQRYEHMETKNNEKIKSNQLSEL